MRRIELCGRLFFGEPLHAGGIVSFAHGTPPACFVRFWNPTDNKKLVMTQPHIDARREAYFWREFRIRDDVPLFAGDMAPVTVSSRPVHELQYARWRPWPLYNAILRRLFFCCTTREHSGIGRL